MDDDISAKFDQVSDIFKRNFQSSVAQENDQIYLDDFHEKLDEWKLRTNDLIKEVLEEKIEETKQFYEQYSQEMNDKYTRIKEQIENNDFSSDINDQLEDFNIYCQSNAIEKRIHLNVIQFKKHEIAEKIQVTYVPFSDVPLKTTIVPLKPAVREKSDSKSSTRISSRRSTSTSSSIPPPVTSKDKQRKEDTSDESSRDEIPKRPATPLKKKHIPPEEPTTPTNDNPPTSSVRIYIGIRNVLTPVLVHKDRDVDNETERITEYSIDSIPVPEDKQRQPSNTDNDDSITLVRAYKALVEEQDNNQQTSTSSSDQGGEEEDEANVDHVFNLKKYNQIDYARILFRQCETAYNCLSSSTKRNELIVYNSKLKILIILQHEDYHQCRHRFYLNWADSLSPNISDITYCQNNDQFLISTFDTSHIYFFNRDLLSVVDLGRLSNDLPLRRIHSYQQTIYCILGYNFLVEYELDRQNSDLKFRQQIKLFNTAKHLKDKAYHLLDVTCDQNYLIVLYSNEHDEIHLQRIDRETRNFYHDFQLDKSQLINDNELRIESTNLNGNFIYLNGLKQDLKAIDFVDDDSGNITSVMHRHTNPTNVCLLKDRRLVVLYEQPYFMSVHGLKSRRQAN